MHAHLSRQLRTSYAEVGRMGYGEALLAHLRFAKLDQQRLTDLRATSSGGLPGDAAG